MKEKLNYNTILLLITASRSYKMYFLFSSSQLEAKKYFEMSATHTNSPLLQLLKDLSDGDGEGERQLAASLPRVRGRDDVDVRFVGLGGVLGVVMPDQILQVTRQQEGLPA